MIKTQHVAWAEFVFKIYFHRLLKNAFSAFYIVGDIPEKNKNSSVFLLPNHNTWWDGFLAYYLNLYIWKKPFFLMMLEDQLQKLSFFKKIGAFGINQKGSKEIINALNYSSSILNKEYTKDAPLLVMFPQGEMIPYSKENLTYSKGYLQIIKKVKEPLTVYQTGIKTELYDQQKPSVYFSFRELKEDYKQAIDEHKLLLQKIEDSILQKKDKKCIFRGKNSVSSRYV